MGLPLFVAPVESDIDGDGDRKPPTRHSSERSRASMIRERRERQNNNARESRIQRRRAAILNNALGASFWSSARQAPAFPWIESGQPPPSTWDRNHGPGGVATPGYDEDDDFPDVPPGRRPNDILRLLMRQRNGLQHGDDLARPTEPPITSPAPPDGPENDESWFPRERIATQVAARFDRSPERGSGDRARRRSRQRTEDSAWRPRRYDAQRSSGSRQPTAMDGLGDRTRSESPEVWDTLLSTLTPDPQPPSVGSSFASTTMSASAATSQDQSAAASSRTSLAEPSRAADHAPADQPCENSDGDYDATDDERSTRPDHLSSGNVPSRHRRFVAALDSNENRNTSYVRNSLPDGPSLLDFLPRDQGQARDGDEHMSGLRTSRAAVYDHASRSADTGRFDEWRHGWDSLASLNPGPTSEGPRETLQHNDGDGDDESVPELVGPVGDSWASNGSGDGSLEGMQRIVRNLAVREDIPDEWWAEAGLSRTIPDNV